MATLSSFLFLLVLVYSIIASQNGFMTLNNVAEARALDVIPYGVEVKASSDLLGRFELRKAVLRRKTGRSATPPPMANNPVHMFIPPAKPFHRRPPPPPPLPPATLGLSPPPPLPLSPPPPPPLSLSPPPPPCIS